EKSGRAASPVPWAAADPAAASATAPTSPKTEQRRPGRRGLERKNANTKCDIRNPPVIGQTRRPRRGPYPTAAHAAGTPMAHGLHPTAHGRRRVTHATSRILQVERSAEAPLAPARGRR